MPGLRGLVDGLLIRLQFKLPHTNRSSNSVTCGCGGSGRNSVISMMSIRGMSQRVSISHIVSEITSL